MNIVLDPTAIVSGFAYSILVVIGILIKMELHDIKSRITRLEDTFIKPKD